MHALHEAEPHERAEVEEQLHAAAAARAAAGLGLALVYAVWACCAWFIFVYGVDLMGLMGVDSEVEFVQSWATSVGVESIYQLRVVVQAVLFGLLTKYAFEVVRVSPQHAWFETWLDSVSVQSTCGGMSALAYARAHSVHFRSVVS